MKLVNSIFLVLILLLLFASLFPRCANIMTPTGGPKDTIPPHLISSNPLNKTLHYHGRQFTFTFDEKIKIKDIKTQLIITPRIDFKYDYKYKKQTVILDFEKDFPDSTTFTFNFRDAIQDLTEGNVTKDNKFVFSTGDKLDSLSIDGYVTKLLTADSLKGITVGLYDVTDTITIFNGSPYYFTESDDVGHYSLENLKNGKYRIYAFKDANKNLKLETNNEMYGFMKDTITLDSNIISLNIPLFNLDLRPLKLQTALSSGHYFNINYNKYITHYELQPIRDSLKIYSNFDKDHKSIRIYNTFPDLDSLELAVKTYDSLDYFLCDTIFAKFKESTRKKEPLSLKVSPDNSKAVDPEYQGTIEFNKPIVYVNKDSLFIQFDTTKIASFDSDTSLIFNHLRTKATIETYINRTTSDSILSRRQRREKLQLDSAKNALQSDDKTQNIKQQIGKEKKPEKTLNKGLQLYLGFGAFISIDGDTSAQSGLNYKFINPVDFGSIEGNINTNFNSYTVQLLSTNQEIIKSSKNDKHYHFTNIPAGNYKIRVLIDTNNDGVWSKGNMLIGVEPEKIYFFPAIISIRADWHLNQDISF